MVIIATVATVVASQALISGAFSLTRQAVQLGYLPRVTIIHTSGETEGQIYIPEVNWLLMVACVALVLGFRESSALADAYGIAVTGTMAITSMLFFYVCRDRWHWSLWRAGRRCWRCSLTFDLSFFVACSTKIAHGGWFPLAVAVGVFTVMVTWKRGRALLAERIAADSLPHRHVPGRHRGHQAAPGAGHGGVPVVDPPRDAERASCTTSSTTRCCTRRWSSCRSRPTPCPRSPTRTRCA